MTALGRAASRVSSATPLRRASAALALLTLLTGCTTTDTAPTRRTADAAATTQPQSLAQLFENTPASHLGTWVKDGRAAPTAELQTGRGAAHCQWQDSVYVGGSAVAATATQAGAGIWTRDPRGVDSDQTRVGYQARATLPADAQTTGYTRHGAELWVAPSGRGQYIYMVNSSDREDSERWVAGGICR